MKPFNAAPELEPTPRAKTLGPRDARAHLKGTLAEATKRARGPRSQRELAEQLELQQPLVANCELQHKPHAPTALHVASAARGSAPDYALELVRWQAEQLPLFELEQLAAWATEELERRRTAR